MSVTQKCNRVEVATGREKADIVIKNAKVVNVFTKEIIEGDIAILDDLIVGVGEYEGVTQIDACGKYVCPGLIDAHVHIESSMVTPGEFIRNILPHGTTTIIADPHEIANVCGLEGIQFMLDQSRNLPANIFLMVPSCVPATPFENNGASITSEAMKAFTGDPRILGLGEVMDFNAVFSGNKEILEKIDLFDNAIIDGHSAGISTNELCAYRSVGVMTNHECTGIEEVLEHLRLGMYVQIREGSGARNLESIIKGMLDRKQSFDRCLFCTDDKHLEDIRQEGHISYNIRKAIQCGLDPVEAIRMATLNPAQCYKLKRLGAIAPGYSADMLILSDLENFIVEKVFFRGKLVSERGNKPYLDILVQDRNVFNTVRIHSVTAEDLKIKIKKGCKPHKTEASRLCEAAVITVIPNQLITKKELAKVQIDEQGFFISGNKFQTENRLNKVAVIERHKATGNIGLGIVKDFGIKGGALASTVAHDSHNLIVVGDNDEDMLAAINELKRVNGGMTVVGGGKVLGTLPLPVAGLMSDRDSEWVEEKLANMIQSARELGVKKEIDPFITMSFLALPVIPEIRVTDRGLFDVTNFEFIDLSL